MGVRGLHSFVTNTCPEVCTVVNLKEMAENHRSKYPGSDPVLVVDAMSCLRHWYTPESWVCGGQWREYISSLNGFISVFITAGIKLVFYFDGVVEQKKRDEWVKRRLKNNKEIARIFQIIKTNKQQPGRGMFFIPSGLATFTRFALKTLGQETICSLQEADYEVASYGLQNNCMGILGEDTDYLIYDTSPYFSINKLHLDKLETIMYSRQNLCSRLGLQVTELPLLACLLGTDIVPERAMEHFRNQCVTSYCAKSQGSDKKASMILAVADYISVLPHSYESLVDLAEKLPWGLDKSILCKGIESYLLPGQMSPWLPCDFSHHSGSSLKQDGCVCLDQEIVQIAKEQHVRAESYMVYNVLRGGEVECSNTLEDEYDTELPGQALIYCPARQHIYSILLESAKDVLGYNSHDPHPVRLLCLGMMEVVIQDRSSLGKSDIRNPKDVQGTSPVVKEWFVYPGNSLQQPDLVQPKQLPGGTPGLRSLWLSRGPEAEKQRHHTFLACFQLQDIAEDLQALEASIEAACSLLIYLTLQVDSLSLEDLHAFMAQALCLEGKSAAQLEGFQEDPDLACITETWLGDDITVTWAQALPARYAISEQLPQVDSRAVQLGSLFVRGLCLLLMANSACSFPFRMEDLMPWHVFDGKLFQKKYQQAHRGCSLHELLEGNEYWLIKFRNLMSLICKACSAKGRNIHSRQRLNISVTERRERVEGFHFPNRDRTPSHPYSYHHQNSECLWRGPPAPGYSPETHPSGLGYRSRHRPTRGQRFQLAPRWPR